MKTTLRAILFCTITIVSKHALAQSSPVPTNIVTSLVRSWTNELGSTLTIKNVDPATGQISGDYTSPSGGGASAFPLLGWVNTAAPSTQHPNNTTVLSFSVRWGAYGSITTWNGTFGMVNGEEQITGQWLLARANSDFVWDHIVAGQDRFHHK